MLDITDPMIFVDTNTAIRQLIERVQFVPENGELKIKRYGELGALLKLGIEPKNEHPRAKSEGVQIFRVFVVPRTGFFKTLRLNNRSEAVYWCKMLLLIPEFY